MIFMVKTMIQAAALATAALVLPRKRATASMASATTALRAVEPEVVDTEEGPVAEISWKTGKLGKTLGKVKKKWKWKGYWDMKWEKYMIFMDNSLNMIEIDVDCGTHVRTCLGNCVICLHSDSCGSLYGN